ncbi:signal peptide-containing protein [Theileria equi strain WA]|uniref:Signal peptide-containing protein n=1 Tax=Theileria equi strain WA TaxID=1537102 RepID=L0AW45_THEEQ|nr:signal peptide-containing protein [Theileria equi strain WA]AFZ79822.1 signal peptide-containing protein [Theileria equi strain WA]|eukprot:XP_004829488.1 signal peptide-containing protein [Theileria equi strain WA]
MRILVLLWTVCLAGLCHCGGDDGAKGALKRAFTEIPQDVSIPVILDLASPDESKILVHTETESGVSFKGYSPKDGVLVSSVVDGEAQLWNAETDQRSLLAWCYAKDGVAILCLEIDSSSGIDLDNRVEEAEDGPQEANPLHPIGEEFVEDLISTPAQHSAVPVASLFSPDSGTLDLPNIDVSKINVETNEDNGVTVKEYYPKKGVKVTSVVYGDKELWKAGPGEVCTFVQSYTKEDSVLPTVVVSSLE